MTILKAKQLLTQNIDVYVKPGGGGDFTTIQDAINSFRFIPIGNNCNIYCDTGTYTETLRFNGIITTDTVSLNIIGDERELAGHSWFNGLRICGKSTYDGSGNVSYSSGGNTVGVSGSITQPNFEDDNWDSGDQIRVSYVTGITWNHTTRTILSTSNENITLTSAWPSGSITARAGFTLIPNRKLTHSSNHPILLAHQCTIKFIGFAFDCTSTSSSYKTIYITNPGASLYLTNCMVERTNISESSSVYGILVDYGSHLNCSSGTGGISILNVPGKAVSALRGAIIHGHNSNYCNTGDTSTINVYVTQKAFFYGTNCIAMYALNGFYCSLYGTIHLDTVDSSEYEIVGNAGWAFRTLYGGVAEINNSRAIYNYTGFRASVLSRMYCSNCYSQSASNYYFSSPTTSGVFGNDNSIIYYT